MWFRLRKSRVPKSRSNWLMGKIGPRGGNGKGFNKKTRKFVVSPLIWKPSNSSRINCCTIFYVWFPQVSIMIFDVWTSLNITANIRLFLRRGVSVKMLHSAVDKFPWSVTIPLIVRGFTQMHHIKPSLYTESVQEEY